jgi:hypothetical protein
VGTVVDDFGGRMACPDHQLPAVDTMRSVLAHETTVGSIDVARDVLDRFGVPGRLRHIGEYVWRGGSLHFKIDDERNRPPSVCYELRADWAAPIFERLPSPRQALAPANDPVPEGRWIRGQAGYLLRIGLNLGAPAAIFIGSQRPLSTVPFLNRPHTHVEHALAGDLTAYVDWFLDTCEPVPRAAQAAARRLREYGLEIPR